MATPITLTVGQSRIASEGRTCEPILLGLPVLFPGGYTEDTTFDLLTYCEFFRARGQAANVNYAFYRVLVTPALLALAPGAMTNPDKRFINWGTNLIITHTPAGYARRAAMISLMNALVDYISVPTAAKRNAILATVKAIEPNPAQQAEMHVANSFKGIAYSVVTNNVTAHVLSDLGLSLVRAGEKLAGLPKIEVENVILTKMEQLIGIID